MKRALPVADRDSAPWWERLEGHELALQRCTACERLRWPARAICNRCGSFDWAWTSSSGQGRIATWLVNRHSFGGADEDGGIAVQVRLAEQDDIVIPGAWEGPADALEIDLPVEAGFEDVRGDGEARATLLRWRPRSR